MLLRNRKGVLASATLGVVLAVAVDGCSSGSSATNDGDAAAEASHPPRHVDASFDTGATSDGGDDGSAPFDGTTGQPCMADAECSPTGLGINKCTIAGFFQDGPIFPTPVCLSTASCDPGVGASIHFCDGPDLPSSKGICLPGATAGAGDCYPKCIIPPDGSAPTGCQGKNNVCHLFVPAIDQNGRLFGIGYCSGGCVADGDCPTGSKCQADEGVCVTAPKPATKQIGQACSANDPLGTCPCYENATSSIGYCTQVCIVGPASAAPCPSGYVCDARLPSQVTASGSDAAMAGFATQNIGLAGVCLQGCSAGGATDAAANFAPDAATDSSADAFSDAGEAGSDAGGSAPVVMACPVTANCSTRHASGPVCIP